MVSQGSDPCAAWASSSLALPKSARPSNLSSTGAGDAEAATPLLARQSSNASRADNSTEGRWQQRLEPRTRTLLGLATAVAAGTVGGKAGGRPRVLGAADLTCNLPPRLLTWPPPPSRYVGLILAPMLAAPKEVRGHQFLPSMALGVLVVSPALTALLTCVPRHTFRFSQASMVGWGWVGGPAWHPPSTAAMHVADAISHRLHFMLISMPLCCPTACIS